MVMLPLSALGVLFIYLIKNTSVLYRSIMLVCIIPVIFLANVLSGLTRAFIIHFWDNEVAQLFMRDFSNIVIIVAALASFLLLHFLLTVLIKSYPHETNSYQPPVQLIKDNTDPYSHKNLSHGAFYYLVGRGAAGVAGLLTVLLLVRFMDVSNYAAYTALSGLVTMCGILSSLGMERVLSRYIPEARMYRSVEDLSRFIWITSAIKLLTTLFILLLIYVLWPYVGQLIIATEIKIFSIGLACFIVGEAMFQHFSSVLQSLIMQKMLTRLMIIQWAGRLLLIVGVVFIKSEMNWEDSLWICAIPEMLGVISFVVVINQHLRRLSVERDEVAKSDSAWPQWNKVAEVGLYNFGFILLSSPPQGYFMKIFTAVYLPVEVVAAYGFFISLAEKVRQYIPLYFFYGMLEPIMIASYLKDCDFSKLSYNCQLLYKSNLLLMVPAIVWIAISGDPIVGLMSNGKFQGLSWILLLVMVQLTIGSHVVLLQLMLNTLEKSKVLFVASMVALPVMMLAMMISIITNSLWLLYTPLVFSLTMNSYIIFYLSSGTHIYKPSWKILSGVTYSGLTAFIAVVGLQKLMQWNTLPVFTALITLLEVGIVYFLMIWIFKSINKSEIELIKNIIRNMRETKKVGI
jgi:pyruvyl transferase EpsO